MSNFFDGFPSVLRVGPFDLAIKLVDKIDDGNDWGAYTHGIEIELVKDQPNAAFALDTVWHEIEHAIYRTYGLDKKSSEEAHAVARATAWPMVFRDNPEYANWFYRMIQPK